MRYVTLVYGDGDEENGETLVGFGASTHIEPLVRVLIAGGWTNGVRTGGRQPSPIMARDEI